VIAANVFAVTGLTALGILPMIMADKFTALLIATVISAIGGGLLEVVVSPIVEAMPKEEGFSMSFLHSFYCWGHAGVIILSTLFFFAFGVDNWNILAVVWCIVPLFSGILFCFVPMRSLDAEGGTGGSIKYLFTKKQFWLLMVVMLAAGASELGMAQWASYFAERGLGVAKALGDILGPCAFAIAMGTTRLLFGIYGVRLKIEKCLAASFSLCIFAYLLTAFSPLPALSLLGCAISGVAVAILWPGSYTLGSEILPLGGTPMFALFALAGDLGCAAGPSLIGLISDGISMGSLPAFIPLISGSIETVGIRTGILLATIFPILAVIASIIIIRLIKKQSLKQG
jgi:MFS family permease